LSLSQLLTFFVFITVVLLIILDFYPFIWLSVIRFILDQTYFLFFHYPFCINFLYSLLYRLLFV